MPSLARICSFIQRRLKGLPAGTNILRYLANTVRYHIALKNRSLVLPYPTSVLLEFTNCCNLACITCPRIYRFGEKMDPGSMDPEKMKRLFDEIGIYLNRLSVTGLGESFLYAHGPDVLSYLKKINPGVEVFISSNLSLNNADEIFAEWADVIDVLQVSIDGMGGTFDKIRRKGSYQRFLASLKKVVEIGRRKNIFIKMNMVVFRENFTEMPAVVSLAADLGIKEVYLNRINPVAINPDLFDESLYGSAAFAEAFRMTRAAAAKKKIALSYPEGMGPTTPKRCCYPWTAIAVTWDGSMVPCCAKPFPKELQFGNVFDKGFLSCLNSQEFIDFRRSIKSSSPPRFCEGCC
jgi:MoaA/NifB/PqqE/SkfB family radical SAM enzyme